MRKPEEITHVFRGRRYTVEGKRQRRMSGYCDDPRSSDRIINIPIEGTTKDNLSTIVHESLHACLWDMSEDAVEDTADSIAKFLWKLNWRKNPNRP